MRRENASPSSKTLCDDLERQGGISGPAGEVRRLPWPRNHPFFIYFFVRCLPSLGRAILISQLSCLPLPPFAFLLLHRHHADCFLLFEARLVSSVVAGRSPPQYRGYWVNPATSYNGILPQVCACLGTWHGGGPIGIPPH